MKLILSTTFAVAIGGLASVAHASDVPCEMMLKALKASIAAAILTDADKAEIDELEAKGKERCNAHDNKRANVFLIDAIRVIGMLPSSINPPT